MKMKRLFSIIGIVLLSGCGTINREYEDRLSSLEEKVDYLMSEKEQKDCETEPVSLDKDYDVNNNQEGDSKLAANSIISFSMAGYNYSFSYPFELEIADIEGNGLIDEMGTYSYCYKNANSNKLLVFSFREEKYFSSFTKANGEGAKGFFLIDGKWWYNPMYSGDDKEFAKQNGTLIENDVYHSYVIEEVSVGDFIGYYYEMKDLTGANEVCFYNLFDSRGNNLTIYPECQLESLLVTIE